MLVLVSSLAASLLIASPPAALQVRSTNPQMGLFDGFAKAFENDASLGSRQNAGLTNGVEKRTITWKKGGSVKKSTVIPGQPLKVPCAPDNLPMPSQ